MRCIQSCFMTMAMAIALLFFLLVAPSTSEFVCEDYSDCRTLLAFKKGVTSDPDGHLQEWNEDNPFCNWTGITCHRNLQYRVVALDLADKRLEGSLSPFLSNLSLLTSLSLHTNNFQGEIPSSLGDLSELAHLNLSTNKLQGQIPSSLQGCRSLKYIDLSANSLSGVIPNEIGKMKNLTYLALAANALNGSIPSSLSNLAELTRLELAANYLTGKIPPELGELKKLEIMYLHVNYLEGSIPSELSNCTALLEISLIDNLLRGKIPEELSKLENLQKMYLHMNKLSGKIPAKLSNLSQLLLLDLSRNELEGEVPMELGMLGNLENLALHVNYLVSGSDKSSFRFLTALANCTRLRRLHLGSCLFAGKLPDSVGDLSKELYHFNISNNRISGNVPESIGKLSSLVTLDFSSNFLEGSLPASLGKLEKLQRLNLGRNRLDGAIPDEIGQMASLGSLDLSNNLISSTIPPSLCDSVPLRYILLSRNRLTGELPLELTECLLLMLLDLSYNDLQGPVPPEIGQLSNLALSLNLSNNNFEGQVPETIGKLVSIEALDFSNNKFSGVIPSSIGSCISLEYLNFSNNMIEGPIPELKKITYLESLDLSHNQLKGTIPEWFGTKEMLKNLNLSYNRLSGEVPRNGRFGNFSRNSFLGNLGLCGGSSQMSLPPCEGQRKQSKIRNSILYPILAVVLGIMFFLLVAFVIRCCFFKKKYEKQESVASRQYSSSTVNWTKSYTERELEVATDGFSEDNLLGRGSFGSVYKGVMDQGRTIVAVKVFHEESSQSYKSLKRECEILSKIKHRNLLRVVGSSWNFRFKALVLEFIPNGNLERHLYPGGVEEGPCKLTLEERMSIAIDVANGLEYLQEGCPTQIVHCDLKPENVLIDYELVARIADFGIGKLLFDKSNEQTGTTGFLRGSIGYIPPEYGQGLEVSVRGDTYSFGVILLEMITRKRPTSSLFSDELSLRKWVVSSFPSNILDVVDTTLKQKASFVDSIESLKRLEKCCTQVLRLALMCTEPNPHERPLMSSVVQMLLSISKDLKFEESHEKIVAKELKKIAEEEMSILVEFR